MAKLVGVIEGGTNGTPLAGIQVIGANGVKREVKVGDYIYEGENIVSTNPQASVEVKYLALSKTVTYDGVFTVLVDNSVTSQTDEAENSLSQDIIPIENNNSAIVTNQTSQMWNDNSFSVNNTTYEQNYNNSERNENNNFGNKENDEFKNEIKDNEPENISFENVKIPLEITSSNTTVFNEDAEGVVLKITANESIGVNYSIENSLDGALFTINSSTGELSFLNSPDYDTPLDTDFDNEYNLNIIATDNEGNSKTQHVSVYINNINDAPIAVADSDTTSENQLLTLDVLANDTDVDSSDFKLNSVAISTNAHSTGYDDSKVTTNASVSVINNKLVFNLGDEFDYLGVGETATVVVSYEMQDEGDLTSTTTSTITITGTNDAPIAVADIATVIENGSLTIDVLANDTDIDSSDFSVNSASISTNTHSTRYDDSSVTTHATVLVVDNKLVFNQGDEFDYLGVGETATVVVSYEMQDEGGLTSTATSTITITGTNDAPVAVADNLNNHYVDLSNTTTSNIEVADSSTINLDRKDNFSISVSVEGSGNETFMNTIFAKGDALSLRVGARSNKLIFSMATEEYSVVEHSDGTIGFTTETINVGNVFFETDITYNVNSVNNITFSYDGINVTITNTDENGVTNSNSIPYSGTVIDPDYLNNNLTIGNGPIISYTVLGYTQDFESSIDANIDNLSMIVENNEVLNTNFENGLTDSYGHTITVGNGATLEYQDKNEDTPLVIKAETLLANDTDIDGDTLSIISVQGATHGTVTLSADGSTITFTPDTNYSGDASFTYTISDGNGNTSTASANFDITSVNDAPVAIGEVITKIADERSYTISPPITRAFTYLGSETLTSNIDDFDTTNSHYSTYNSNIFVLDDNVYYTYDDPISGTAIDLFDIASTDNTTIHDDGDIAEHIDSVGYYNEGVIFDFAREVDSIIIKIDPTSPIVDDDNVEVRVYSDNSSTSYLIAGFNQTTQTFTMEQPGFGIKRIAIFAKDGIDGGQTEFRIQSVTGTYTETKTLDVFTIDKDMLLANDTDIESTSLSLKLGNGILYDESNVAIGTVSINAQGDITVTPNAHFDATDFSYPKTHISTHFSYSVVDADGGESSLVNAIVNVKVGTDTSDGVTFTQGDPVVTLEGTTITTKPVDTMIIGTDDKDTFSINGTIDLSNVSSIEGIELNNSTAKLIGSGVDGAITLNDVISATDSSNDLIINASDHNASDQITVDDSFTKKEDSVIQDGSVYDLYYGSNGTTLLVEIHQEIV